MSRHLCLTIASHPIVAEKTIQALRAELARVARSSLAKRALTMVQSLIEGDTMAAHGHAHAYEMEALEREDREAVHGLTPEPRRAVPASSPCIAYDPATHLIWGYGDNLALCLADAGWSVTESQHPEIMAQLCIKRAHPCMRQALEEYGPDLSWITDMAGVAVPENDLSIACTLPILDVPVTMSFAGLAR